jgi:hypothetical protein
MARYSRNAECPCGSGRKYKKCCLGEVDWERITTRSDAMRHASLRGKNRKFIESICDVLQVDRLPADAQLPDLKRAFTPEAVANIHEQLLTIWPDSDDLDRVLAAQRSSSAGLFTGNYDPDSLLKGITRHALYSDSVLLIDPFCDPRAMQPEYNPLEVPEQFILVTFQLVRLWIALAPWIDAGIVMFVKELGDFDSALSRQCSEKQWARVGRHPEIKDLQTQESRDYAEDISDTVSWNLFLYQTNERLLSMMRQQRPEMTPEEELEWVEKWEGMRDEHPDHVRAPDGEAFSGQLLMWSSGTNYEMSRIMADASGSHLITDFRRRWLEMEIDRKEKGVDLGVWEPFAKAFQNLPVKFLDNVPLGTALDLRNEGKLSNVRDFLGRTWNASLQGGPMDESNVERLRLELEHHLREAEAEWSDISRKLGRELAASAVAGVAHGIAAGVPAGVITGAAGGVVSLGTALSRLKGAGRRYPAGFLLRLGNDKDGPR